ncbi:HAD family hydrolase [Mesobacillus zeae]|uniref:HAD family hydrolase n=1 Tax=Mesobacillus zeae TaxID=1917180 RepID=UPI0015E75315|nr:HAD family hydrolase [Mesobacillus zeae]
MTVKVVVLDLDGTLLNSKKQISSRNLNAVLNCHKSGKKIIIATARPPRSVKNFLPKELLDNCSFAFYNGALVCDYKIGYEEHSSIPRDFSKEIIEFCKENFPHCTISFEVKDKWYSNKEITDSSIYNLRYIPHILTNDKLIDLEATKIMLSDFNDFKHFKPYFTDKVKVVVTDNQKLIQITNKEVSKETGILKLCSHYEADKSETIVFGDDYNDLEMFRMSGYSVAMLNAVQELKGMADEITDTNDNDGVAKVLKRFV